MAKKSKSKKRPVAKAKRHAAKKSVAKKKVRPAKAKMKSKARKTGKVLKVAKKAAPKKVKRKAKVAAPKPAPKPKHPAPERGPAACAADFGTDDRAVPIAGIGYTGIDAAAWYRAIGGLETRRRADYARI